jgi:pyruvate kinase
MRDPLDPENISRLRSLLLDLRRAVLTLEEIGEDELALVHPARRVAARNLIDYLAVRQQDLRDLQHDLYRTGLSTFGVVHRHVMASIAATLRILGRLSGKESSFVESPDHPPLSSDRATLDAFADEMFGEPPGPGMARIMVTMPSEAGRDPDVIASLLAEGMSIMRVNCAHDGPEIWTAMVRHLRAAEGVQGRRCRVAFDLAGPKLRTGPVAPGPEVVRVRPSRDELGRTIRPALVRFGREPGVEDGEPVLLLDAGVCSEARAGDELRLTDARGRKRVLVIDLANWRTLRCVTDRTTYLISGTRITLRRGGRDVISGPLGTLPAREGAIPLATGDELVLTRALSPGRPAVRSGGDHGAPATIGCSLPEVFESVRVGHRVLLDDGKFEGVIREASADRLRVQIVRAGRGRALLRGEKGINFPDTELDLPALTEKDVADLEAIARHADMVSLSFVHRGRDIETLYRELSRLAATHVGVVLKIENRSAFERLPELIMIAAQRRRIGVMVARGDLGVEIGFERLAEVQEEILWLCEAAQVPVIWATQVLESLAKDGLPSRGEVTDAAMSTRAECIMLNKGPYIGNAMRFLHDVRRRMAEHTEKTFATHRALKVAATSWLEIDHSGTDPLR